MAKSTKTAKPSTKTEKVQKSHDEMLADMKGLEFQTCQVVKGNKFPLNSQFDCIKIAISSYNKPYVLLDVDGVHEFCDPANLKALKPMSPAKIAAAKAAIDAAREATLLVSGVVQNESEKSILLKHHGWYKARWIPKSLISVAGEHEDGEQTIYEVARWKIGYDHGPRGLEDLEGLQSMYEKMLEPKQVVGKTTLIKRRK